MAGEPAFKRQRSSEYDDEVGGEKIDGFLFAHLMSTCEDGQVSYAEAKRAVRLCNSASLTEKEKTTFKYMMRTFDFTEKATTFMKVILDKGTDTSYYKEVDGVQCDRELYEAALLAQTDGQVSVDEAKSLWKSAMDDKVVTKVEHDTLDLTLTKFTYTLKAGEFLRQKLEEEGYYKSVDDVKCVRNIYFALNKFSLDGQVSYIEAKKALNMTEPSGMTPEDKSTFKVAMKKFFFTEKATGLVQAELQRGSCDAHFRVVDDVLCNSELYELAQQSAKDGQVSFNEAKQLWDASTDGKGQTAVETATLELVLKKFKFTDKAAELMKERLAGK